MKVNEAEVEAKAPCAEACRDHEVALPTLLGQGSFQEALQGRAQVQGHHIAPVAVVFHPTEWKYKS